MPETYPAGNPGQYPLDPTSEVGKFRLVYGDITSEPYVPEEPGYENYEELSDAEIEGYLAAGGNSVNRAIGYYYLRLSSDAAKASKAIKDYDLSLDTTKRAADLRATAALWFERADEDEANDGGSDIFEVFDTNGAGSWVPEGTQPVYGRRYTWDRIR